MERNDTETVPGRLEKQEAWLQQYSFGMRVDEQGLVISVGDGIARVSGLPSAAIDDILVFDDGSRGMVFDLTPECIGAILLKDTNALTAGTPVSLRHRPLSIPVGDTLLGRIIDPLGVPLDNADAPKYSKWQRLESASPPVVARDFVHEPLYTGNKIIDTLIPIGRGQRQLLIGDEGLGRSSLAIDTIINQRHKKVFCVYVMIGQKRSAVVNTIETLRAYEAMDHTVMVVAEASTLPGLQFLAPFAGCAIAEFWMQQGHDTLVIYDDLTTHAKTYRELSLLLRRPPGREAYPGDIFSVHARLLERATCLNAAHGGGTMTALPIVETSEGEIAAYIPTNLISITDGQIYLDRGLFVSGQRPAIDIGKSVSRLGGQVQHPNVKREAGRMKLDYLQFLELEVFTRFGARLEASMEEAIHRGLILKEILVQERLEPLSIEFQLAWLIAFNEGFFHGVKPEEVPGILKIVETQCKQIDLTIDSPREKWVNVIGTWLTKKDKSSGLAS